MNAIDAQLAVASELNALRERVAALERSERQFQSILATSPQGSIIHTERVLYCNDAAVRLFGYDSAAELRALSTVDLLFDRELWSELRARRRARLRGDPQPQLYEMQGHCKDGSLRWLRLAVRRVEWDGEPAVHCTYTDISDRKCAEDELEAQRRLLRAVLDALPQWVAVKDREERYLLVNRSCAHAFGRPMEDIIGRRARELGANHPASLEVVEASDRRVLERHETVELPGCDTVAADGTRSIRHMVKVPLRDDAGHSVGLVCISTDIAGQQTAQIELQAQRRLLQTVFDAIPAWLFVKDREGRYLMVNEPFGRDVGVDPPAFRGRSAWEMPQGTREQRERTARDDEQLVRTGQPLEREDELTLPGGRVTWRRVRKVPLLDEQGRISGIVGLSEDITEQQRAQDELRAQRRLLQAVFDAIPTWLFVKDRESRFIMVNDTFARDVGRCPADFRGLGHDDVPQGTRAQRDKIRRDEERLVAEGQPLEGEEELTLPDGRLTLRHVRKVPLRDEQGQIIGIVGISEDISGRRQMEEQLRRMQRMEAIGTLAGGIAHDFNNILFPIIGFTELTMRQLPPDGTALHNLSIVRDAALRAKDLVSQILTFSRRTENRPEVIPPQLLVRETLRFLRSTLPRTVRIEEQIAAGASAVFADAAQLHQVLMNLCVNAAHAMPDGGTLTVSLGDVTVSDFLGYTGDRISGHCVRLLVSDTGAGMDAATLPRIFEPFFTTKPVGQGTGLGLSTVLGIVSQHKGVIDVRSAPGEGATFVVLLPAVASGLEPLPGADCGPSEQGQASILFVDDEQAITELATEVLEERGYRVSGFTSSVAALQAFQAHPEAYDLVITDQTMPGLTGDKLVRAIRAVREDLPILLGTGFSELITPEGASALGIDEVFYKPLTPNRLCALVRQALSLRAARHSAAGAQPGD
jgi:PAS domain S-box-containing protein